MRRSSAPKLFPQQSMLTSCRVHGTTEIIARHTPIYGARLKTRRSWGRRLPLLPRLPTAFTLGKQVLA